MTRSTLPYAERRRRNNLSVRRSREKARKKIKEIYEKVEELKKLNLELEAQIIVNKSQLQLFLALAEKKGFDLPFKAEIEALLNKENNPTIDNEENENAIIQLANHKQKTP